MDKKKILVVDDESNIRVALQDLLAANNYEVELAVDGQDGVEKAQAIHPDLILLDIMMPKLNGLELLKKLKTSTKDAHVPIIILSAKSDVDSLNEAMWNYADKYITKPYQPEEILHSIKASLDNSFPG